MKIDNRNLTMIMDLYELTMANGIFAGENKDTITYFDMFFRRVPDNGGFAIMAGIEQLIDYLNNLHFDDDDIELTDETSSADIDDWDSLEQINLVVAIQDAFNVKFNIDEVNSMKNVGEMVDFILEKLGA